MKRILTLVTVFALVVMGSPIRLSAYTIDSSAFSGNETVIDFSTPFQRTSSPLDYQGVTFRVIDWPVAVNSPGYDLAVQDDWGYFFRNIPGASGGYALNDFLGNTQLRMEFATNVNRVGLLLSAGTVTSWTMIAWDNYGNFIEAANAHMPADNNAVFLGLETLPNIAYVDIIQFQNDSLVTLFDDIPLDVNSKNSFAFPS